jgi:hypothetical protein
MQNTKINDLKKGKLLLEDFFKFKKRYVRYKKQKEKALKRKHIKEKREMRN